MIQNAEPVASGGGGDGIALRQINRQAIAVAITLPGPREPGLAIGAASHQQVAARSVVAVVVENTGNVHLRPAGEFILIGPDGSELTRAPVVMDTVYAGSSTLIEIPFLALLAAGEYSVTLFLNDADTGVTAAAESLALAVPELEAPEVVAAPVPAGVTVPEPPLQAGQGTDGLPLWLLAVAIPVSLMLGGGLAVGRLVGRPATPGQDPAWIGISDDALHLS